MSEIRNLAFIKTVYQSNKVTNEPTSTKKTIINLVIRYSFTKYTTLPITGEDFGLSCYVFFS